MAEPRLEGSTYRLAAPAEEDKVAALTEFSISALLSAFLTPDQVARSRSIMGLDRRLIADGTYVVVHDAATRRLAAGGGRSRRAALYGGDHSTAQRNAALLKIAEDAARNRAMYTHPDLTRRGLGRYVLSICEGAARAKGFTRVELTATMSGKPLYRACGYEEIERIISA